MSPAGIVALAIGLFVVLGVCMVASYVIRDRQAERLRLARQRVVAKAEQSLRDSTYHTLRAMNEVIRQQYRQ